jgi:hypothetical protein
MAIIFYDVDDNIVNQYDTEDKPRWCADGETKEHAFIRMWGGRIGYKMNPQKKYDKFLPDLISTQTSALADLKSQHTPFFTAMKTYGIEPKYAVVFNVKDRVRYDKLYPEIDIVYYVNWIAVKADIHGQIYQVSPFMGIYKIPFKEFLPILDQAPVHKYGRRISDLQGNAKESYLFDIRQPGFVQLV